VRLRIRRLGGIAGVTLRSHLDTAELPAAEAARVERALRDRAGHAPAAPPHPDAFRYEITPLSDSDLDPVLLEETDVPPELHRLVESVAKSGKIEPRNRPR
jgi:Emfourin